MIGFARLGRLRLPEEPVRKRRKKAPKKKDDLASICREFLVKYNGNSRKQVNKLTDDQAIEGAYIVTPYYPDRAEAQAFILDWWEGQQK